MFIAERGLGSTENGSLYAKAHALSSIPGVESTREGLEEVEEWIGLSLLARCNKMTVDEDLNAATTRIYEAKGYEFRDHATETGCTFKVSAEIPAIDYVELTGEKARLMTMGTRVTISTMGIPKTQVREEGLTADIRFGELTYGEHRMIGDHVDFLLSELNDKITI